jgi:hypothetical protein
MPPKPTPPRCASMCWHCSPAVKRQGNLCTSCFAMKRSMPGKKEPPAATSVDWSSLDEDDGQPGELPNWAKRQIKRLERLKEEDDAVSKEMIKDMIRMHKWTRSIPPPSAPKKYDPNEPLFDPAEIFGRLEMDDDSDDELNDEP